MKVIKLDNRHKLRNFGFTHAFRFDKENKQSDAVKKALYQIYPDKQAWNKWWHWNNQDAPWGYYTNINKINGPYWIGVKNEADISAILLML